MPNITESRADVVVIGAGVIGLSTALELARRGVRVRLLGAPNAGAASLAAAGLLAPSIGHLPAEIEPFYHASLNAYPEFLDRLRPFDAGLSLIAGLMDVSGGGTLYPDTTHSAAPPPRALTPTEIAAIEPALAAPSGALMYAQEAAVDNVRLVAALRAAVAREALVDLVEDARVERVDFAASSAAAITVSGAIHEAQRLVLAAGAWSGSIAGLPSRLPIEPLKGQMLALDASPLRRSAMSPDVYLVPRGRETLVGATVERAGFDLSTNPAALEGLRRAAIALCPALATAPVTRSWAGLRPATPDLRPILGSDPNEPRLIYACGHSKNGILLAPATASALARLVLAETQDHDLAPFAITRFYPQRTAS